MWVTGIKLKAFKAASAEDRPDGFPDNGTEGREVQ